MTSKVNDESEIGALKKRLDELIHIQANERAELAAKISNLLEENDDLNRKVRELEAKCKSRAGTSNVKIDSPENEFGLDFSLPEERK
ncbi:hypothetical protein [Vreelandella titanicae]|uniref:hypothetical protein n=1 Tax=Vreelandella titanicae TaxID=664683 RepID=UPI001593845C|nr:hypothetical protein [Halomonas titanicae]NVE92097.1 hypothetical protein [Halomonas titanicae]|tara:strand:+ start:228 stop:488 length:261 start_codon:yes stop_codon:yes gene_type:complete